MAERLGERLGYRVVSREVVVQAAAANYGVSEQELQNALRSPPGFWDKLTHKRQQFILAVLATLADIVQHDNVVYYGIAGQLLLRDMPNVLKLLVIAPMEARISRAMKEQNLTLEDARRQLQDSDNRRITWMRRMYQVDARDPGLYDLTLNLGQMSIQSATDMVTELLEREEYKTRPETLQRLKEFALRLRIRADLTFRSDYGDAVADVTVHGGTVHLTLQGEYNKRSDEIVRFVQQIPDVQHVDLAGDEGIDASRPAAQARKTAEDLMVPLKGYPHIRRNVSIREAVMAMAASAVVLSDGHIILPRYLLVLDDDDRLVGVINRRHLLRGLTPQYGSIMKAKKTLEHRMQLTDGMFPTSLLWSALFSPAAAKAALDPVSSVMIPPSATVDRTDTLGSVVGTMLQHDIDILPVTERGRAVGVVLMTDVFDNVAEYIMESGAKFKATT